MNSIVKLLLTAGVVLGLHYGIKHFVAQTVRSELGDQPAAVTITVDPAALRQAQEVGRAFDNSARRAAIEDATRRIDDMNRTMRPTLPTPPFTAGMPHH